MRVRNQLAIVLVGLALVAGGVATAVQQQRPEVARQAEERREQVIKDLPIADLTVNANAAEDADARAKRNSQGKKYDDGYGAIGPGVNAVRNYDWPRGLPALPVAQSDAIVIGAVSDAKAFLSPDETTPYSEFTVTLEAFLKDCKQNPIKVGTELTVERPGGRVLYPSGEMGSFTMAGFGVPRVGHRYLLFLKRNPEPQAYTIVTGYELREGRVYALDVSTSSEADFSIYNNSAEAKFLDHLQQAIKAVR